MQHSNYIKEPEKGEELERWTIVFRALANINRLKIILMLSEKGETDVSTIAEELKISFKATSNHLTMLKGLGVLEAEGSKGHVYYSINKRMPSDFREAIGLF